MFLANFNDRHPELREDEAFVANVPSSLSTQSSVRWETFQLSAKRMGEQAYDSKGSPIPGFKPVFAHKAELDRTQS